jgi:HEPN domain-containing protein
LSRKEEERNLARRSEEFLDTAKYQAGKGFYDLAVFSLEQALQLFLKSRILSLGMSYPRTHSVRRLLETFSEIASGEKKSVLKEILEKYLFELGALDDAYITSRYVTREYRKEEVEKLEKVVREIIKNVG